MGNFSRLIMKAAFLIGIVTLAGCHHQGDRHGSRHDPGKLSAFLAGELKLDSSQEARLKSVLDVFQQMEADSFGFAALAPKLAEQLRSDKINELLLKEEVHAHAGAMEKLASTFIDRFAEFQTALSADQREKLARLIEEHKEKHKRHFFSFDGLDAKSKE